MDFFDYFTNIDKKLYFDYNNFKLKKYNYKRRFK